MASVNPYIVRGALGIALLPGFFGLNALLRPEAALRSVQFPVPSATADPQSRKLVRGLMRIYGIRNVVFTYFLTLTWYRGDVRLLGFGLLGALPLVLTDGLVSREIIGGGEWSHWGFAPVIAGVAAGLLGYY